MRKNKKSIYNDGVVKLTRIFQFRLELGKNYYEVI